MKKLLVERAIIQPAYLSKTGATYLVESNGSTLVVKLPVTVLDEKNLNSRIYSTSIMENACRNARPAFEARELLSSVNEHPSETAYVTPGAASHVVTDAWVEGKHLYNKWEVLNTAAGRDLRALIEANVAFGVSIRGLGSVDNYGNILDDYEYLGTDCVSDPSARLRVKAETLDESVYCEGVARHLSESADFNAWVKHLEEKVHAGKLYVIGSDGGATAYVVSESSINVKPECLGTYVPSTASSIASTSHTFKNEGTSQMKTRQDLEQFLAEQQVLLKSDLAQNRIAAYQRLTRVEKTLSESQIPAQDLARVYQMWEPVKAELVKSLEGKSSTPLAESAETADEVKKLSEELKLAENRSNLLKKLLRARQQQLHETAISKTATNAKADSAARMEARRALAANRQLKESNSLLAKLLAKTQKRLREAIVAREVAIEEAVKSNYGMRVAIKEAAKVTKLAAQKPVAKLPVVEAAKPVGRKPVERASRRHVESGEHGMKGWI